MLHKKICLDRRGEKLLSELFDLYSQKLYRIAWSILRNELQAEDATQEAFVKVIPYLQKIENAADDTAKYMMVNAVRRTSINQYRKNRNDPTIPIDSWEEADESEELLPMKRVEDRDTIDRLLRNLQPDEREIICFRCFYELNYKEIAAILEISEEAAMKRFQRAREAARAAAGEEDNGYGR